MQSMVTISSIAHLARDGQSSVSSRLSLGDSSRKLYHVARVRELKGNVYSGSSATRGCSNRFPETYSKQKLLQHGVQTVL